MIRFDFTAATIYRAATAPRRVDRERAAAEVRALLIEGKKLSPLAERLLEQWRNGELKRKQARPKSRPPKRPGMVATHFRDEAIRRSYLIERFLITHSERPPEDERQLPSTLAIDRVAKSFGMSAETVRSILYRKRRPPVVRTPRELLGWISTTPDRGP